jgi:hypothetical protein
MNDEGAESFDCAEAWETSAPFLHVKNYLYRYAVESGDFHVEYPYDELFNMLTAKFLLQDAMDTGKTVIVHYKWEPLDESVVIYSAKGKIVYTNVALHDEISGFVMEGTDGDSVMVFSYKEIFWVAEVK